MEQRSRDTVGRSHRISAEGYTYKSHRATAPPIPPRGCRRAEGGARGGFLRRLSQTQTHKLEACSFGRTTSFIPSAVTYAHQNLKSNLAFVNSVNGVLLGQFTGKWTDILNWISALAIRDPFSRSLSPLSAADRSLCEH